MSVKKKCKTIQNCYQKRGKTIFNICPTHRSQDENGKICGAMTSDAAISKKSIKKKFK